jgi:rare lipoprotein A
MEQMTAAHRTLPFNTRVRVFDLENGRTVEVRINDRGPFVANRVIDLSRAAARALAMLGPGSAQVRLEVLRVGEEPTGAYAVQVGAFRDRNNAERIRREMESRYGVARLVLRDGTPSLWRVLVGSEVTENAAAQLAARIRQDSDENTTAFVVRVDAA